MRTWAYISCGASCVFAFVTNYFFLLKKEEEAGYISYFFEYISQFYWTAARRQVFVWHMWFDDHGMNLAFLFWLTIFASMLVFFMYHAYRLGVAVEGTRQYLVWPFAPAPAVETTPITSQAEQAPSDLLSQIDGLDNNQAKEILKYVMIKVKESSSQDSGIGPRESESSLSNENAEENVTEPVIEKRINLNLMPEVVHYEKGSSIVPITAPCRTWPFSDGPLPKSNLRVVKQPVTKKGNCPIYSSLRYTKIAAEFRQKHNSTASGAYKMGVRNLKVQVPSVGNQRDPSVSPARSQQGPTVPVACSQIGSTVPAACSQEGSIVPAAYSKRSPPVPAARSKRSPPAPVARSKRSPPAPAARSYRSRSISPGPRSKGPSVSPGPRQKGPSISPGPRSKGRSVSPGPRQKGPPVSPGPRQKGPSVSPGPRQKGPPVPSGRNQQKSSVTPVHDQQGPHVPLARNQGGTNATPALSQGGTNATPALSQGCPPLTPISKK